MTGWGRIDGAGGKSKASKEPFRFVRPPGCRRTFRFRFCFDCPRRTGSAYRAPWRASVSSHKSRKLSRASILMRAVGQERTMPRIAILLPLAIASSPFRPRCVRQAPRLSKSRRKAGCGSAAGSPARSPPRTRPGSRSRCSPAAPPPGGGPACPADSRP